jgi:hypothetical protein
VTEEQLALKNHLTVSLFVNPFMYPIWVTGRLTMQGR